MIEFRQPKNDSEKELIYRLRYDVYCVEKKFISDDQYLRQLLSGNWLKNRVYRAQTGDLLENLG